MAIFRYPAVCPNCKSIFPSGFSFGLRSSVTLSGNRSQCPYCGSMAVVPDGVLEVMDRGIKLFSGPDFTLDVLRAFQATVEDLRSGTTTPAEAEQGLAQVHRGLAQEFREWSAWGFNFVSAMAAAAALVVALQSQPSNRTVDEVAIEGFESVYEQVQPQRQRVPTSPRSDFASPEQPRTVSAAAQPTNRPVVANRAARRAAAAKAKKKRD